ncbi:MAG: class I SAM-dependent methyltransferase [Candidatus Cloacimonetes bacterium]|nr:class I SAM-dependent methyltransferase [Candidatus Cloacimonadota bacterium]
MVKSQVFDDHIEDYERWFTDNIWVYKSELQAIRTILPETGDGIEIGIGSGLFAQPLGIRSGIEPSRKMRETVRNRGLNVIDAVAEKIPYPDQSWDYALMVTTICFVDDPLQSLQEINRILKWQGHIIIGFVDKNSPVGKLYLQHQNESIFYREAVFYSTEEIYLLLRNTGFKVVETCQTVFGLLDEIKEVQPAAAGYGKGSFVVIKAQKYVH